MTIPSIYTKYSDVLASTPLEASSLLPRGEAAPGRNALTDLVELDVEPARASPGGAPARPPNGLYVIGLRETVRGDLFETRRDSLALARHISRDLASER